MKSLKEKIEKDFQRALKERKEIEVSTLRLLKAAIFNREREKRYKIAKENPQLTEEELERESTLSDEEIERVVISEVKKRKEAILEFERGKRKDLAEKERKEMEILKRYLPKEISKEEIEKILLEVIEKVKAKDMKDMGKVMKEAMARLKGKADGGVVAEIVKNLLSKK